MKLKKVVGMAIIASVLTMTAACASTETPKDSEKKEEAKGAEPVKLRITWWGSQPRHEITQKVLDLYTKENPHVTFEAVPSGWDGYFDKLATQAAGGQMPDIIQMDYLYMSTFTNNNSLTDLKPFVDDKIIDVANIDEALFNTGVCEGKLSGIIGSSATPSFVYNPKVLKDSGLENPKDDWSWDDWMQMSKTVKEKTGNYGIGLATDINTFRYYLRTTGEELYEEDNKSLAYKEDKPLIEWLKMQKELVSAGAMPNPDEQEQLMTVGDSGNPLVLDKGAFKWEYSNYPSRVAEMNDTLRNVLPPNSSDGESLWIKPGVFWSIADTSINKEEAAKFINWYVNSEEAAALYLVERGIPTSTANISYLKDSGKLDERQIEMLEYQEKAVKICGKAIPADPVGTSEIIKLYNDTYNSVLLDAMSLEEAAAQFRKEADIILARNNK